MQRTFRPSAVVMVGGGVLLPVRPGPTSSCRSRYAVTSNCSHSFRVIGSG